MKSIGLKELRILGRDLPERFSIAVFIEGTQHSLVVAKVLRALPTKRLVVLTHWKQELVVAKLFIDSSNWSRHVEKEKQGIAAVASANLATVNILAEGTIDSDESALLIFNYLGEHSFADQWNADEDLDNRKELLSKAIIQIALGHEQGLWQHDCHLGNFFQHQEGIYLVDGADIQFDNEGNSLSEEKSLENLALFFAQFPVSNDFLLGEMLVLYQEQRQKIKFRCDLSSLLQKIDLCRQRRMDILQKKLFRETTAHKVVSSWNRLVVIDRKSYSPEMEQFISSPDEVMETGELLKNGNSSTVVLVKIGSQKYVVKRNNIKNFWHGISRLFRPSRAKNSWCNAHRLLQLGILTPSPVLMLEVRIGWLRRRAYYLSEYVFGNEVLQSLKEEKTDSPSWKSALQKFENLFRTMKRYRIKHGDMKATNFILGKKGLYVLDLDSMRQMRNKDAYQSAYVEDLNRFARNWKGMGNTELGVNKLVANLKNEK